MNARGVVKLELTDGKEDLRLASSGRGASANIDIAAGRQQEGVDGQLVNQEGVDGRSGKTLQAIPLPPLTDGGGGGGDGHRPPLPVPPPPGPKTSAMADLVDSPRRGDNPRHRHQQRLRLYQVWTMYQVWMLLCCDLSTS